MGSERFERAWTVCHGYVLAGIGLMVGGFTVGLLRVGNDSGDVVRTLAEVAAVTDADPRRR